MEDNKQKQFVLIVDDVESNRFVLRDIIKELGVLPVLTQNGKQALEMVERRKPALIILDIAMPDMDGYEVCQKLKENPMTRDIPIVFISAFDNPKDVVKGFEIGGDDYITKPFIKEVVKARVGLRLKLNETSKEILEANRRLQMSVTKQLEQMELEKRNVLYALRRVTRETVGYDENHVNRMRRNCKLLAEAMQLSNLYSEIISDRYIEIIELAASLCNLGNVGIPTQILQKTTGLTPKEQSIMQHHTVIGAGILEDINKSGDYNEFLRISHEIALNHHERWDGSGYPEGKKENEIPISAQIVAMADEYCELTEKKMNRDAYSKEEALGIMEKESGQSLSPDMFRVFKLIQRQLV